MVDSLEMLKFTYEVIVSGIAGVRRLTRADRPGTHTPIFLSSASEAFVLRGSSKDRRIIPPEGWSVPKGANVNSPWGRGLASEHQE